MSFDVVVIGAGIVGISTAWQLKRQQPKLRIAVLEQENRSAPHQTGNNSGVIHSGLYYKPGSLKAKNCVRGREMLYAFCQEHDIAHERCGKLVLAVEPEELPRLQALYEKGKANGLQGMKILKREEISEYEPFARGVRALWIQETGIVDYGAVTEKLVELCRNAGVTVQFSTRFLGAEEADGQLVIQTDQGEFHCGTLVNCAGLQSDRVAKLSGVHPGLKIVPFRGEYYKIKPQRADMVKNLIYPVPDPQFPFLGVHFTRMINGEREAGPNAVLAFKREGYKKTDFSMQDMADIALYGGFWRMSFKHWKMGLGEFYRSYSKAAFVKALQRMIPEITGDDVVSAGSGVRAQALEPDGFLADDFRLVEQNKMVHVLNAPSPAATAGLSIGEIIAHRVVQYQF